MANVLVLETVREDHLLKISSFIVKWRRVAIYLGLSAADIEGIRENYSDYDLRKYKVLETWRRRCVEEATYQCLIDKAKENDDAELARKIEEFLGLKTRCSICPPLRVPCLSNGTSEAQALDQNCRNIPPQETIAMQIKELQNRFSDLTVDLTRNLMAKKVTIEDIILHIAFRPKDNIQEHLDFICNEIPDMRKVSDVIQLMMKFRMYMMFLDHSLLKEFIDKFANEDVKQKLHSYEVDIQHFCMKTHIADFNKCWHECSDVTMPEFFTEFKMKQNMDPNTHTLNDLEIERRGYARQLKLVTCAMIFLKAEVGCVESSWAIPTHCIPELRVAIRRQENMDFFVENGLTMISVGDELLYLENEGQSVNEVNRSSTLIGPAPTVSVHQTTILGEDGTSSPPPPLPLVPDISLKIDFEPHSFYMNSNGQYPSITMNNQGWILQVYHKETVVGLKLRCRIGHLHEKRILWSNTHSTYNKGFYPNIAINNKGLVVAVFASQVGRTVWYRVGQLKFTKYYDPVTIPSSEVVNNAFVYWRDTKILLGQGMNPVVTLSDDNTVVVAFESGFLFFETSYRIGDVRGEAIEWRGNSKCLVNSQHTKHASIAINKDGLVAIGYSNGYTRTIHYTSGKISTDNDSKILMSETMYTPPGANFHPIVSLNNHGHVVAVFHNLQGRLNLKINHGTVKMNTSTQLPCIEWSHIAPHVFAINGYHPSVAVNDQLDMVTSHKSLLTLSVKKSIRNYVGHLSDIDMSSPLLS